MLILNYVEIMKLIYLMQQKAPTKMPRGMKVKRDDENDSGNNTEGERGRVIREGTWQMWHLNGTRCPKGTVPVRRSTVHDVLRAKSTYDFGTKQPRVPLSGRSDAPDVMSGNGHEVRAPLPMYTIEKIFLFS